MSQTFKQASAAKAVAGDQVSGPVTNSVREGGRGESPEPSAEPSRSADVGDRIAIPTPG
jgi:hypothetical protein